MQFRELTDQEIDGFVQWARNNYRAGDPINALWHPVIRDECAAINRQAGFDATESDLVEGNCFENAMGAQRKLVCILVDETPEFDVFVFQDLHFRETKMAIPRTDLRFLLPTWKRITPKEGNA